MSCFSKAKYSILLLEQNRTQVWKDTFSIKRATLCTASSFVSWHLVIFFFVNYVLEQIAKVVLCKLTWFFDDNTEAIHFCLIHVIKVPRTVVWDGLQRNRLHKILRISL